MRTWGDLCSWICFKALGKGRYCGSRNPHVKGQVTSGARGAYVREGPCASAALTVTQYKIRVCPFGAVELNVVSWRLNN